MRRQVFGRNPVTGRVEHYYRDEGPSAASVGKALPVIRTFAGTGGGNGGVKVQRAGSGS